MELLDKLNSPALYTICGSIIAFIAVAIMQAVTSVTSGMNLR